MKNPTHCLIVEDHVQARTWLQKALLQAFDTAPPALAGSVAEGISEIDRQLPDLALLDLGLPDGSGTTLIDLLNEKRTKLNVELTIIVSTVMNDDDSIFNAIRAGADGYILKEESLPNLVGMLQGIQEDKPPLSPSIALRLLTHFRAKPGEEALAPREEQILQLLAKGFTVPKVAEMLEIKPNTAASYVKEIYRKLKINSRAEATLEASRRGLV